jgi:hypothetical protein
MLRDRVLIKPMEYEHPVLATPGMKISKGVVLAVGYGHRQRRKTPFHQKMGSSGRTIWFEDGEETGKIIPMQVMVGDVVEFGFRNSFEFDASRLGFPDLGKLLVVWQKAIYSIDPTGSPERALLWQQSAGYDRNGNYMSGAEDWHRA